MNTTTHSDIKIVCLNAVVKFCAYSKPIEIEDLLIGNSHQHLQTYFPGYKSKEFHAWLLLPVSKMLQFLKLFLETLFSIYIGYLDDWNLSTSFKNFVWARVTLFTCMHCE